MKLKLFLESDSGETTKQIKILIEKGYEVIRCTQYQFKIGSHSYYPGTGTIVTDPCQTHAEKGLPALLQVLKDEPRPYEAHRLQKRQSERQRG